MSRAAAACATQAGSNWYVVTLPDGRMVTSSQPLLHNAEGAAVNTLTIKSIKTFDPNSIYFLAQFLVLCGCDDTRITFQPSGKKLEEHTFWNTIFQFLFGADFGSIYTSASPLSRSVSQLACFSACIARPALLLATNDAVHAALCGDEDLARRMIERNPNYLLQRGNAIDFSGRTYTDLTPFQAALVTGDDAMAEMMKPYFDRLPNGQAEMQKQITEIFPNGIEAHEAAQKQKSKTNFEPILNAVTAAIKGANPADLKAALSLKDNGSKLCKALDTFRGAFAELSQEKIFNPHYLLAAFEAFANQFDWNTPDWNKLDLFWRQVIGFVQRFLPATYAQAFAYGLYDIVENKHSCPRSFNFKYDYNFSFYPLGGSFGGLGFDFATAERGGEVVACGVRRVVGGGTRPRGVFKIYVEQKQQAFRTYYAASAIDSHVHNPVTSFR